MIRCALQLRYAWAYKYAKGSPGIGVHADDAAINVNLWITDDQEQVARVVYSLKWPHIWWQAADVGYSPGGLLVYKTKAHPGSSFEVIIVVV